MLFVYKQYAGACLFGRTGRIIIPMVVVSNTEIGIAYLEIIPVSKISLAILYITILFPKHRESVLSVQNIPETEVEIRSQDIEIAIKIFLEISPVIIEILWF